MGPPLWGNLHYYSNDLAKNYSLMIQVWNHVAVAKLSRSEVSNAPAQSPMLLLSLTLFST